MSVQQTTEAVHILALSQLPHFSAAADLDSVWVQMARVVMVSPYVITSSVHMYAPVLHDDAITS